MLLFLLKLGIYMAAGIPSLVASDTLQRRFAPASAEGMDRLSQTVFQGGGDCLFLLLTWPIFVVGPALALAWDYAGFTPNPLGNLVLRLEEEVEYLVDLAFPVLHIMPAETEKPLPPIVEPVAADLTPEQLRAIEGTPGAWL